MVGKERDEQGCKRENVAAERMMVVVKCMLGDCR